MATVRIHRSGVVLSEMEAVSTYLSEQGVSYQHWGVERLNAQLNRSDALSPDEQEAILRLFEPELSTLRRDQGYRAQDIVALSEATPNLETVLEKFKREHHHTDDEVRFVVDGSGVFTIRKGNLVFDVIVAPGDLFVVPAFTRHSFDLTAKRKIKCIRVFKDPAGWAAIYDEPSALTAR